MILCQQNHSHHMMQNHIWYNFDHTNYEFKGE